MFTSISWQEYLIALLGITTIYYLSILLWFYRTDLLQLVGSKRKVPKAEEDSEISNHHSIMGAAKDDESFSSISSEELEFSGEEENSESVNRLNQTTYED